MSGIGRGLSGGLMTETSAVRAGAPDTPAANQRCDCTLALTRPPRSGGIVPLLPARRDLVAFWCWGRSSPKAAETWGILSHRWLGLAAGRAGPGEGVPFSDRRLKPASPRERQCLNAMRSVSRARRHRASPSTTADRSRVMAARSSDASTRDAWLSWALLAPDPPENHGT